MEGGDIEFQPVEDGGYRFQVGSRAGPTIDGAGFCMQKVIRNEPEQIFFNYVWLLGPTSDMMASGRVAGCERGWECDCNTTPCQVAID